VYSPQLIFIGRYETIRMSQQSTPGTASNLGNISTYTIGYRYNPFMTSRAGFAWHNEYNWLHQDGTGPTLGLSSANINTSELLLGFDFDF
jgi:membrane protein YqaA with SNARE-associated domain